MSFFLQMVSKKTDTDFRDEDRLVSLLKQGDEGAFRVLVRQYHDKTFRIAFGITLDREESLDIVQEVFLKVHQNIQTFKGEAKLSTWLHRITINQCHNLLRRWKRRFRWHHQPLERDESGDYPELGTDDETPVVLCHEKEFEMMFQEKLRGLPDEARAVFVLKEVEGLSYDEIARVLNIKRGTVSSRLFYARQSMKEALQKYLDEAKVNDK